MVNEAEYREKKAESLNKLLETYDESPVQKRMLNFYNAIKYIKEIRPDLTQKVIADKIGVNQTTISDAINYNIVNN